MKIKRFIGKNVRGYMNFDITFNDSLTFLIGINGSGKTTVLRLISGLITPSLIDLAQIEYSEIELQIEIQSSGVCKSIRCKKNGSIIKLSCDNYTKDIELSTLCRRNNLPAEYFADRLKNEIIHFEEIDVVQKIKELKTPLFLGLNRRSIENAATPNAMRNSFIRRGNTNIDLMLEPDYVDNALNDIQDLFDRATLDNTRAQNHFYNQFNNKLFEDSLTISNTADIDASLDYSKELSQLEEKEKTYYRAIEMLGKNNIESKSKKFFDEIKNNLRTLSNTANNVRQNSEDHINALMNWIINLQQFKRLDKIITYSNEYSENIAKLREPFTRFVDSVNIFFSEGGKEIKVEGSGKIKILLPNTTKKQNSIYELSSGEKQLVIIFAYISFYKKIMTAKAAPIFIIDEPELSLHISWQEKFVDALLKANPDTQFIMATHAPAIIAKNERKQYCVDLSKKN